MSETTYSKLLGWEIWNFMSIEHAEITFDERNIVNLKGYNDSGKSATLLALKVLLLNVNPTKQKDFIQDGKDFFRVIARFDDGVSIKREKYLDGKSLYEMSKDDVVIYTTASKDGVLTKVQDVPEPIAQYLGLIMYEDTCLNARSCIEQLIGVSTKGADNYKLLNTVLKSEELATATTQINKDRNAKDKEIQAITSDLKATQDLYNSFGALTKELITHLKETDTVLDNENTRYAALYNANNLVSNINSVQIVPELDTIDLQRLNLLMSVNKTMTELSNLEITPELTTVDSSKLKNLLEISNLYNIVSAEETVPELQKIDDSKLQLLLNINRLLSAITTTEDEVKAIDTTLAELDTELNKQLEDIGDTNLVKCPACGTVFDPTNAEVLPHKH